MKSRRPFAAVLHPALLGLALLLAAGCAKPVSSVRPAYPEGQTNWIQDERVIVGHNMRSTIGIVGLNTAEAPSGHLMAQLTIQNLTANKQRLEYRCDWKDANGMVIEAPQTRWLLLHLMGSEQRSINVTAPHPDARDFIFNLKQR